MIEGSGSESIPLTSLSGSESRRPQNKWIRIRIRIRNTAYNEFARCSEPASLHGSGAGSGHQHHGTDGERDLSSGSVPPPPRSFPTLPPALPPSLSLLPSLMSILSIPFLPSSFSIPFFLLLPLFCLLSCLPLASFLSPFPSSSPDCFLSLSFLPFTPFPFPSFLLFPPFHPLFPFLRFMSSFLFSLHTFAVSSCPPVPTILVSFLSSFPTFFLFPFLFPFLFCFVACPFLLLSSLAPSSSTCFPLAFCIYLVWHFGIVSPHPLSVPLPRSGPVLRIRITLMRIRIRLFTRMLVRILILFWCGSGFFLCGWGSRSGSDVSPWCGSGSRS